MTQPTLSLRQIYLNHPVDEGCEIATNYLKKQSLCRYCPFEHCVKDIKYSIRVLLQNNKTLKQVYEAHHQGLTIEKIGKLFQDIPLCTIQYWIKHRNRIQKLFKTYSWFIPYIN